MSISTIRIPLVRARQLAEALIADLAPGCERIEVAGSIRRRKPEVGDLEIVCVPKLRLNVLGESDGTHLDPILERLQERGDLKRIKGGSKYKQYELPAHGCKLDLFLTTAAQWGLVLLIRTGPAEFSKRFVTRRLLGGLLPNDMSVHGGYLWRKVELLQTPEEETAFALAGVRYLEPWART